MDVPGPSPLLAVPGDAAGPAAVPAASVAPPVIRKLDERVVNKIAAGEVIQRPVSALKEMLENCIDAGATQITVLVKEGGNKLLQITDNGHGIRREDLPLLCHRHTTSKLREYEDLETISSLGFRGEALCSISFVSHMTVTTMARGAEYGFRATFKDSELEAPGPRPVASVPGTTIAVEDLFYNVPTRRKALKSASEEYSLILDMVGRYAAFCTHVAMTCKRHGDARPDVSTPGGPGATRLDAIRAVYGAAVARELLPLELAVGDSVGPEVAVDDPLALRLEGYISGASYSSAKKTVLVLFINGRAVECGPLRRALEGAYAALLPKAARPWALLDLRLPPRHVEVNLHPTKREVGFMHQDEIIDEIRQAVEAKLLASNDTRTFAAAGLAGAGPGSALLQQSQLPFALLPQSQQGQANGGGGGGGPAQPAPYRPDKLVRTDHRSGTLDTFVTSNAARAAAAAGNVARKRTAPGNGNAYGNGTQGGGPLPPSLLTASVLGLGLHGGRDSGGRASQREQEEDEGGGSGQPAVRARHGPPPVVTQLASVRELLEEAEEGPGGAQAHDGGLGFGGGGAAGGAGGADSLAALLREHTFVGMADPSLALVQHGTRLYLLDVAALSRDMFYQLALRRWEQAAPLRLEPPPLVSELVMLGLQVLQAKGEWQPADGSPEELCALVCELLQQKGPMLEEYLAVEVDEQGRLLSLPVLLEGHAPDLARLPDLLMALARDVEWEEERECFRTLAGAFADFYAVKPPVLLGGEDGADAAAAGAAAGDACGSTGRGAAAAADGGDGGGAGRSQQPAASPSQQGQPEEGAAGRPTAAGADGDGLPGPPGASCPQGEAVVASTGEAAGGTAGSGAEAPSPSQPPSAAPDAEVLAAHEYVVKNIILPAMRTCLRAPRARATDGSCVQVAALEKLYRIFERC